MSLLTHPMAPASNPSKSGRLPAGYDEVSAEDARLRFGHEWQNPEIRWDTRGLAWSRSLVALRGYAADECKAGRDCGIYQQRRGRPCLDSRWFVCAAANPDVIAFEFVASFMSANRQEGTR